MISELKRKIIAESANLGFAAIGFTHAQDNPERAARLHTWLQSGYHADMTWMEERAEVRQGPQSMWAEARSVIALGMSYAPDADPLALTNAGEKGRISVYAQGRDYHDVMKKALKALARFMVAEAKALGLGEPALKVFVDTAPVMEKPLAEAAGLGWQGKHANIISHKHGNWLFLGAIYTVLEFAPDLPGQNRCGSCHACQLACPTDAFPAPYIVDAQRCISYLTIENKGPIPLEFRKAIGNRIYGCDDCLAVCPWNKFAQNAARHAAFIPREDLRSPDLAALLTLDDAAFRAKFSGSPIKRIGRARFIRNCLIAAGNSGDITLLPIAADLCADPDPVVAECAQWAKAELISAL